MVRIIRPELDQQHQRRSDLSHHQDTARAVPLLTFAGVASALPQRKASRKPAYLKTGIETEEHSRRERNYQV